MIRMKKLSRKKRKLRFIRQKNRLRSGLLVATKVTGEFMKDFSTHKYSLLQFFLNRHAHDKYKGWRVKLVVWPCFGYDGDDFVKNLMTVVYGVKLVKL